MKNLNLTAPINPLSYGIVGTYALRELSKHFNVALFPKGQIDAPQFHPEITTALENSNAYDKFANSLLLWHQFEMAHHVGKGQHIGWPIFELNRFNNRELVHLRNQDALIVCSEWAAEIIRENINHPKIHVVPLGYDPKIFYPPPFRIQTNQPTPTRFISIGKWEHRKGYYELLDYFSSAFTPKDNVELVVLSGSLILKQSRPELVADWENYYKNSEMYRAGKVKLVDWVDSQSDVANYMRKSDCFISLSRAEGFNLGAIEALACGLQSIITNYSGHTEFSTIDNSFLINIDSLDMAYDGVWFDGKTGEWAVLGQHQKEQAVDHMQHVHEMKQLGWPTLNKEGLLTAQSFTWEKMGERLKNIL